MRPKTVRICEGDISHDETLTGQDEFDVQADIAPELFRNLLELLNQLVTKLRSAIASPAAPYSTVHVAIAHPCVPEGVASRDAVRGVQQLLVRVLLGHHLLSSTALEPEFFQLTDSKLLESPRV